jgi:hypothetical protein
MNEFRKAREDIGRLRRAPTRISAAGMPTARLVKQIEILHLERAELRNPVKRQGCF